MSRISALAVENAPHASRPWLDGVQKAYGMLPNVFKVMAHSPATLASYVQFFQAMEGSTLTPKEREVVSLAVSQVNGCEYCLSVHTLFAGKAGVSTDDIRSARDGSLDALTRLAQQITQSRGQVSDDVLSVARAAGLSDEKIVDVIGQVTLLTFSNLINNVAKTTLDFPPVAL